MCGWLQFIDALGPICLFLKGTLALCSSPVGPAKQHIMSICLGERTSFDLRTISTGSGDNQANVICPVLCSLLALGTFSSFHGIASSVGYSLPSWLLSTLTH